MIIMPTSPANRPIRILFLASNPTDTVRLRLDEESRAIGERLDMARFREHFELIKEFAVRRDDLTKHLLKHQPHIVHFSGHGSVSSEIILEEQTGTAAIIPVDALRELFRTLKDNIRCVVLNACYSEHQARAIADVIDCVVGMAKPIEDKDAVVFAAQFYQGLAFGRTIQNAFELGKVGIAMQGSAGVVTPQLIARVGVDPGSITLVGSSAAPAVLEYYEDPVENVWKEFDRHTTNALGRIRLHIPGVAHSVERREVTNIQSQLEQRKSVIFTGEAGTGKSGIAAILANSARSAGTAVFLIDARKVGHIRSEAELRQHIPVTEPVSTAIRRVGDWKKGCLVIIDQLDNIAGSAAAETLIDFAVECSQLENSSVAVISRKREAHEIRLFQKLNERGFVELTSHPLDTDSALRTLNELGINSPLPELVMLSSNLLNLELIGLIGSYARSKAVDKVSLSWVGLSC